MVEIFDDRVEIYNPGGLPKGLPIEQFGKRSVCRNPLIAGLMLRCDYIEKMGTGIVRIQDALHSAGCKDVMIETKGIFNIDLYTVDCICKSDQTSNAPRSHPRSHKAGFGTQR